MDQTALFRACVKAMKMRKKHLFTEINTEPREAISDVISTEAKEIVRNVAELKRYLISTRKDYINSCHVSSTASKLGDDDRHRIDSDMEKGIRLCNGQLRKIVEFAKTDICTPQLYRHRQAVIAIVEAYLKALCKLYNEQKAVRIKKITTMKRMSRLSSLAQLIEEREAKEADKSEEASNNGIPKQELSANNEPASEVTPLLKSDGIRQRRQKNTTKVTEAPTSSMTSEQLLEEETKYAVLDENLDPSQRKQLQKENEQIYQQMNSMVDELKQIEGKVVEVARLQEIFTEKILEQDDQVMTINEVAITTTENVKYGNEQIREAMKRGADMRVWILFFLLVLTFTLLFLDWYND